MENKVKANGLALIPLVFFIVLYMGVGIYLDMNDVHMAFYQFPAPTAVFFGLVLAFIMFKGSIEEKFDTFIKGCGEDNIIIMCIIYLLAGAFSTLARASGGVDSFVNLGLTLIPPQFMAAGIFIISCLMSLAIGTSMGTIAAIGPIAMGVTIAAELNMALVMAAVIGGAMFGDNLAIISDTTIAATRTLGIEMRDKFRMNIIIAAPAALITLILLLIFGRPDVVVAAPIEPYDIIKIIPYGVVLVAAMMGVNVFVVLVMGIALSGGIGIFTGDLTFLTFSQQIDQGFRSMINVFFTSLLIGGMAAMVRKAGGLQFLIEAIQKMIKGKKSAELGMAALMCATDAAIANNTVAIIIDGPIAKEIAYEYKVDPRRAASIIDIFSCVMQGAIPYGAQMLLMGTLAVTAVADAGANIIAPGAMQVIPLMWYQWLLGIFAVISIFVPFADGPIKKNPWDWERRMESDKAQRLIKEGFIQ